MSAAAATRPTVPSPYPGRLIPLGAASILVESRSRRGEFHENTPGYCPCKAFEFSKATPQTCPHQQVAFPAPVYYCVTCGTERVTNAFEYCAGCAAVYGASLALVTDLDTTTADSLADQDEIIRDCGGVPPVRVTNESARAGHAFVGNSTLLKSSLPLGYWG